MKLCYLQARFESETPATSDYDKAFNVEQFDEAKKYVDSIFNRIADDHKTFEAKIVKVLTNDLSEDDLEDLNVDLDNYSTWVYIGDDKLEVYDVKYEIKK